jgi:N-methylhydantoinase A
VTDADVVLGFIDPDGFLDGRMALDRQAADDAIAELANGLGLGVEETAAGIVRINSHSAATLIRQRTVEQGLDPRDFVLYAFGGAGPVHAFAFAEELGVAEVVIPLGNGASLLSAYGISASDVLRSFERECHIRAPFDPGELAAVLEPLEAEALQEMRDAGFAADDVILERVPILRYAEQFPQELPLTLPTGPLGEDACAELAGRFDAEYVRLYGEGARAVFQNVEIFTMRVDARVPLPFAGTIADAAATDGQRAVVSDETRPVFWPQEGQWVPTALHDGRTLAAGHRVVGPALVELPHTTVAVAAGQSLRRDHVDNLVLETA